MAFHRVVENVRKTEMQLREGIVERYPTIPTVKRGPVVNKEAALSLAKRALPRDGHAVRRILACVDHSSLSEACVRHAIAISKSLGGTITLLHVMQPPHERAGLQAMDVLDWEIARQEAGAFLGRLEQDAAKAAGQHVETRLEQGHPAERITAVARELDADVTILGSQGERGVAPWNLGSTVLQVLAVAHGSLLVVRSSTAATDVVCPKRILVPLDGSVRAESVLPTVVRIASMHGAELLLALVIQEPIVTGVLCSPEDLAAARALATRLEISGKQYLDELRGQLEREGASARTLVLRSADERHSLLELSRSEQSDLIVLSAHGSNCNPEVVCGSVTVSLLTHSVASLLVLQDLRDAELRGLKSDRRAPPLRASCPPVGG
jgi:nucleotide-binding universal stress UspA family protein